MEKFIEQYRDNRMNEKFTFRTEGIEITGTRERLKELVSYISFEESEPSNALADVVSEIELELNLK